MQFKLKTMQNESVKSERSFNLQASSKQLSSLKEEPKNKDIPDSDPFKLLCKYIRSDISNFSSKKNFGDIFWSIKMQKSAEQGPKQILQPQTRPQINLANIEAVIISKMGIRNYDNMENQDVVLSDQIFNKCKIYAIFDGHGEYGKMIAKTASTIFKNFLHKYSEDIKNDNSMLSMEVIVKKTIQKTNLYLLHYKVEEAQFSGTTALIVVITKYKIYSFNIGNSRLVLAKHYQQTNRLEPFQVTHDQTISRFDERSRVLESGGVIAPFKDQLGQSIGPERIWVKNQKYPGIFITRALGLSCAHKIGLNADPEISVFDYKECYKYLIMGSDGFWAVEDNDEVIRMLEKSDQKNLQAIIMSLMNEALKRWRSKSQLMDDITLIAIPLF